MRPALNFGYVGAGAYLPDRVLTNDELEALVDTSDDWIVRRSGIRERRIMGPDETVLGMATTAARRALEDAGVEPEEVTDIRVGVNSWARFPSLATQVQAELGIEHCSAADVSAGCAGFIYAVEEAYNKLFVEKLRDGRDGIALVIGAEALSHITDWTDRSTCVLLGDGAGAVVIREVDSGGILAIHTSADGRYGDVLYSDPVFRTQTREDGSFSNDRSGVRPYLHMDGRKVYAPAVRTMVDEVKAVVGLYNRENPSPIAAHDVSYVFPHQANLRIIEKVAGLLEVPMERVYTNGIERYGNTSTASIPIAYVDPNGRPEPGRPGDLEIDVAFGAGFAAGAILRELGHR